MLQNTFIHIPGIGRTTERELWNAGVRSWADLGGAAKLSSKRKLLEQLRESIPLSEAALSERNTQFFSRLMSMGEAWRLYDAFADECAYLDIETTGLSSVFNTITMVGLYDGREYKLFVEGHNLHELPDAIKKYRLLVTFNGAQFDLRFLRIAYPGIRLPNIHIDLRWLTTRLGYHGGLKQVESDLRIIRPKNVAKVSGYDATVLWARYQRGDESALRLLVAYNTQDVLNLKTIMGICYDRLASATTRFLPRTRRARRVIQPLPKASNFVEPPHGIVSPRSALVHELVTKARARKKGVRVVGIDLTGSERRASGWALLNGCLVESTALMKTDRELIDETIKAAPDVVSIDSPLSLPGGLENPGDCKKAGLPIYRACELALKRMGISVFWCLLPTMESLTMRGIALTRTLRAAGISVIESYPGAAQDLLRIPRKGVSLEELRLGLHRAGVDGSFATRKTSHDEVDAITSALVGLFYLADEHIELGNAYEDYLIIPRSPEISYDMLAKILKRCHLDDLRFDPTNI